jgi:hypothetical protein
MDTHIVVCTLSPRDLNCVGMQEQNTRYKGPNIVPCPRLIALSQKMRKNYFCVARISVPSIVEVELDELQSKPA